MATTVKLLAYIMRVEISKADATVQFARNIDKTGSYKQKEIVFDIKTIEDECRTFALACQKSWDDIETVSVKISIDINPQSRKPKGWNDRPRTFIINVPENTSIM